MKPQFNPADEPDDATPPDISPPGAGAVVQHPDGWYWLADSGRQQFGPYATAELALAEMAAAGEDVIEPGETLYEAEDELGIADWVDPETGEPAEDTHTRLEDH